MKIFKTSQIKDIDTYTIENEPIHSINLMERAANQLKSWILQNIDIENKIKIFAGPGNNGGDALALARLLFNEGYQMNVWFVKFSNKLSSDAQINYNRLKQIPQIPLHIIESENEFPILHQDDFIIEGIFGSGLTRPVEGLPANIIKHINDSQATTISIDIPSGLFGENNSQNNLDHIIQADYTLTLQFPKLSFLFRENDNFTGAFHILPIGLHPQKIQETATNYFYTTDNDIKPLIKKRTKHSHKGTYGHSLLISGSYGKMGAAVMSSAACLRTGVGLHTCHVPKYGCEILQTALPESMVSIDENEKLFGHVPDISPFNAIGIGPGIGMADTTQMAFKTLINKINTPLVIDADGLNILSQNKSWLHDLPGNTILTPHPKEFERLSGKTNSEFERLKCAQDFAKEYNVVLVLKGANTCVIDPQTNCYFNSTGNPGMATAGSGDVLTGMILSLLAQGYSPLQASLLGVYIHGSAGDLACCKMGEQAMIAGDIINHIGDAYRKIKFPGSRPNKIFKAFNKK
jgi:NAD(P)H-hydrate epimerase